eukprot:TRINITY_DN38222_c0_g1_i1.p1 TRINITY_DN38222_c0_g1~~TRINITY_DN38222_c0_g1_i1.p1  ORF type:complete len:569 (+),score=79.90 TRINITY_DN38222_c0_g1_i1:60-1766(+)
MASGSQQRETAIVAHASSSSSFAHAAAVRGGAIHAGGGSRGSAGAPSGAGDFFAGPPRRILRVRRSGAGVLDSDSDDADGVQRNRTMVGGASGSADPGVASGDAPASVGVRVVNLSDVAANLPSQIIGDLGSASSSSSTALALLDGRPSWTRAKAGVSPNSTVGTLVASARYVWAHQIQLNRRCRDVELNRTMPMVIVGWVFGVFLVTWDAVLIPVCGLPLCGGPSTAFHSSIVLGILSYLNAFATDPGAIPEEWDSVAALRYSKERKSTGFLRFCNKEGVFKPDRAHYCRALSRNVLRMDHYCPWLNTCVGHYNYKYFFLFVTYALLASGLTLTEIVMVLHFVPAPLSGLNTYLLYQNLAISSLLSTSLVPLLGFHTMLTLTNTTTIEFCEKRRHPNDEHSGGSPYDRGWLQNVKAVMGEEWYLWPLPIGGPAGNGLVFPRSSCETETVDDEGAAQLPVLEGFFAGVTAALAECAEDSIGSVWCMLQGFGGDRRQADPGPAGPVPSDNNTGLPVSTRAPSGGSTWSSGYEVRSATPPVSEAGCPDVASAGEPSSRQRDALPEGRRAG